jgi:hypothetical protein
MAAGMQDGSRSGEVKGDGDGHANLTVSVFLRDGFVRELEAGPGVLSTSIEECIRSLYPSASVSVREAGLLDGDWEVQIGELGRSRMGGADRGTIERHLRSLVGEAISWFQRSV